LARVKRPLDHPRHIGVDGGRGALVRERRHGARRVSADAGQAAKGLGIVGDDAAVIADHVLGEPVEVGGAAIVAQAFPALADHARLC
jgi:hypothetical protein